MQVWKSPQPLPTEVSGTGPQIRVGLSSSVLRVADYIVEAAGPDGTIRETYLFRAVLHN